MIPSFIKATLIREDMWMVWLYTDVANHLVTQRLVPAIDPPHTCPGGRYWCAHFGCDKIEYVGKEGGE